MIMKSESPVDMLTQFGQGRSVTVRPQNAELTTHEMADCLNASSPVNGEEPVE